MIRYLNPADIYTINQEVLGKKPFVRDRRLLVAACSRPMTRMFGQEAYPTLMTKAAALLHALAHDHPFADGNKRTATVALVRFLNENGLETTWTDQEAYDYILQVAQGQYEVEEIADWLEDHTQAT